MITQLNHLYSDADLLEIANLFINHIFQYMEFYEDAIIFGICDEPQNIKISWETILALKAIHHSTQN